MLIIVDRDRLTPIKKFWVLSFNTPNQSNSSRILWMREELLVNHVT